MGLLGRVVTCSVSTIAGLRMRSSVMATLMLLFVVAIGFFEKSFEALYDETCLGVMLLLSA